MDLIEIPFRSGADYNAAADINQLMKNAIQMGWKPYRIGTTYTNGTPGFSMTAANGVCNYSLLVPYILKGPIYMMRANIWFQHDSVASNVITLTGFSAQNAVGAVSYGADRSVNGWSEGPGFNVRAYFTSGNYTYTSFHFDEEITAWPTWADTV